MKVYNEDKTQILTEYDLTVGELIESTITVTTPEIKGVEEIGHYEVLQEYPNGGKDVKWVVDIEGVEYQPARTYEEEILVYVPFTEEEKIQIQIEELKALLVATDYQAIKFAEGILTAEEYAPIKAQRQAWRDEINMLEND